MKAGHARLCYLAQMVNTLHGLMESLLKSCFVRTGRLLVKLQDLKSVLFNSLLEAHTLQLGNHPLVINFKLYRIRLTFNVNFLYLQ